MHSPARSELVWCVHLRGSELQSNFAWSQICGQGTFCRCVPEHWRNERSLSEVRETSICCPVTLIRIRFVRHPPLKRPLLSFVSPTLTRLSPSSHRFKASVCWWWYLSAALKPNKGLLASHLMHFPLSVPLFHPEHFSSLCSSLVPSAPLLISSHLSIEWLFSLSIHYFKLVASSKRGYSGGEKIKLDNMQTFKDNMAKNDIKITNWSQYW